jgi:mono/diheme cytochrome c family protein
MTKYLPTEFSVRRIELSRTITKVLAAMGLLTVLWAPYHAAIAQQEEVVESGRQQFNQKCAVCHGLEGQGDGVLAAHLKAKPADLSGLSERNGGIFPFWETYGKIDGRDAVGAHGSQEMPAWGTDERYEGLGGRLAMGQILEIVFFLQSIQEE